LDRHLSTSLRVVDREGTSVELICRVKLHRAHE